MNGLNNETARDFLESALGDEHATHTVVSKREGKRDISATCSCSATMSFLLSDPLGARAVKALRLVENAPIAAAKAK